MRSEEIESELSRCVKCGSCRSGCPTFTAVRREGASARGRLAVIGAHSGGEVGFTDAYKGLIKNCTLCGSCTSVCPNDVDTASVVIAARAEGVREGGLSLQSSFLLKNVLDSDKLGAITMRLASRFQGLFMKKGGATGSGGEADAFSESGLISRFRLPFVDEGRLVPELAQNFFLDRKDIEALGNEDGNDGKGATATVAFFAGCGINYMLPHVGEATVAALKEAGAKVVVPQAQGCCGMPALSMGDIDTARSLALKTLEAFENTFADFITTACATCTYALKKKLSELLSDEPELRERALRLSAKTRDITELLANELPIKDKNAGNGKGVTAKGKKVTYHDPCHLSRGQGLRDEPRALLDSSGAEFVEMKNPCRCCGLGGGLGFTNYPLSMEIACEKVENIKASGADVVATACPGCMIQLRDGLNRFGVDCEVKHVVELL